MYREEKRKRIIYAVVLLGIVFVAIIGVILFIRYQNTIRDENVNIQPTFTGRPDSQVGTPSSSGGQSQTPN